MKIFSFLLFDGYIKETSVLKFFEKEFGVIA